MSEIDLRIMIAIQYSLAIVRFEMYKFNAAGIFMVETIEWTKETKSWKYFSGMKVSPVSLKYFATSGFLMLPRFFKA